MEEKVFLDIAPSNPSGWAVTAKMIIGLVIGSLIAFLIFLIVTLLGRDIFTSGGSALVPVILALIAFVGTFIGNVAVGGAYNLFYSGKYYDFGKMFSFILLGNSVLLVLITPIYFLFGGSGDAPFLVLAFHVFFSVFITQAMIEILTNPNYAGSSLMGTLMGLAVGVIVYMIAYKITYTSPNKILSLMMIPSIASFSLMPLIHALWEKVYYKSYEVGNNFLYIPSLQEVAISEEEMETNTQDMDDINVSL